MGKWDRCERGEGGGGVVFDVLVDGFECFLEGRFGWRVL